MAVVFFNIFKENIMRRVLTLCASIFASVIKGIILGTLYSRLLQINHKN